MKTGLRYRIPLPGPFYYSGRVGPKRWLLCSSHSGSGPMGFIVKWFIVYPSIAILGLAWLSWVPRFMVCSGWCAAGCGVVRGVGRSFSVFLFSVLFRSGRFSPPPTASSRPSGPSRLRRAPPLVGWWTDRPLGSHSMPYCILRFVIVRDGGCGHVCPHRPSAFRGVLG